MYEKLPIWIFDIYMFIIYGNVPLVVEDIKWTIN